MLDWLMPVYVEREGKPHKVGVIFLVSYKDKFLLEDRIKPDNSFFGYTLIPGGKLEEGETPTKAAERELREEYGLEISSIQLIDVFTDFVLSDNPYEFHAFLVRSTHGNAIDCEPEKSKHRWVTYEEAEEELVIGSSRNILARAKALLDNS